MSLVEHARRELALIGEDSDTAAGVVSVVQAFADCGHSGGSAPFAIAYLERLLRYEPLGPLTDDPAEWRNVGEETGQVNWWQNIRDSRAISHDGGRTYWMVDSTENETPPPVYYSTARRRDE